MTEKRFIKSEHDYDWWFVFDIKQEYIEEHHIPHKDMSGLIPMSEDQVIKLLNENEQLYELINFANTLIAFKTSESCQKEWKKRLKELIE